MHKFNFGFLTALWFFFPACNSLPPSGFAPMDTHDSLISAASALKTACFASGVGSVVATFKVESFPPVTLEGRWDRNYQDFTAQFVSTLGETLAKFEFKNGNFVRVLTDLENFEIEKMELFAAQVSILGPRGLRTLMCGLHAIHGKETQYFKELPRTEYVEFSHKKYFSHLEFVLPKQILQVSSTLAMAYSNQSSEMLANSKFAAGFFKSEVARVTWQGNWNSIAVQPKLLKIAGSFPEITLIFSEFE